jgi:hypothetical protein
MYSIPKGPDAASCLLDTRWLYFFTVGFTQVMPSKPMPQMVADANRSHNLDAHDNCSAPTAEGNFQSA